MNPRTTSPAPSPTPKQLGRWLEKRWSNALETRRAGSPYRSLAAMSEEAFLEVAQDLLAEYTLTRIGS